MPAAPGVYGWWFRVLPTALDVSPVRALGELTLLYMGISPRQPPNNGRAPSSQSMRSRVPAQHAGNAEPSTLRKTLGCLRVAELGSS